MTMRGFPTAILLRRCAWTCLSVGIGLTSAHVATLRAQITALSSQNEHRTGQYVSPVYEGWYKDSDGSTKVLFGYQNLNTEEIVDVPIGPNNKIEPGAADQGQPTHFLTGRQYGVFAITVPKNAPATEMTWTLNVHGHQMSIPANLSPLFVVEALKTLATKNEPPSLQLNPKATPVMGPFGTTTTMETRVGNPLTVDVWAADDTIPPARPRPGRSPDDRVGLRVTWSKYRGAGPVDFSTTKPPLERGKASTVMTFTEPGEYMLRVVASDGSSFGSQCCWTNGYVKVTVRAKE
jgi:hypothetical protein